MICCSKTSQAPPCGPKVADLDTVLENGTLLGDKVFTEVTRIQSGPVDGTLHHYHWRLCKNRQLRLSNKHRGRCEGTRAQRLSTSQGQRTETDPSALKTNQSCQHTQTERLVSRTPNIVTNT